MKNPSVARKVETEFEVLPLPKEQKAERLAGITVLIATDGGRGNPRYRVAWMIGATSSS